MSPWARVWLGAAIGALIVLVAHPMSRPFYQCYLWRLGDSRVLAESTYLASNVRTPPEPTDDLRAAFWIALAADAVQRSRPLSRDDAGKLARLCTAYAELDPENAFWRQVLSLTLWELGDMEGSKRAWIQASFAARWNDLETERLRQVLAELRHEFSGVMGWHYAALYPERSLAVPKLIQRQASRFSAGPFNSPSEELDLRTATLINGVLIRQHARTLAAGEIGAAIVANSYRTAKQGPNTNSRRYDLLQRYSLIDRLRDAGRDAEALQMEALFRDNDGWLGLANTDEARDRLSEASWMALAIAATPGIGLVLAAIGALVAMGGVFIERYRGAQALFTPAFSAFAGVVLALSVYAITRLVMPALWVALLLGFFAFVPSKVRSRTPSDLGIGYSATIGAFALIVAVLAGYFVVGLGAPGLRLLPLLDVPREYGSGSVVVLAITGVVLGLTLATAPAWGMIQRLPAPRLAGHALRRLGTTMLVGCLVLSLVAGPVAVVADHSVADMLRMQLENEPLYLLP